MIRYVCNRYILQPTYMMCCTPSSSHLFFPGHSSFLEKKVLVLGGVDVVFMIFIIHYGSIILRSCISNFNHRYLYRYYNKLKIIFIVYLFSCNNSVLLMQAETKLRIYCNLLLSSDKHVLVIWYSLICDP